MTIVSKIEQAGYVATTRDVEQLATMVVGGAQANGTYLRVLVVAVQSVLGKPAKRGKQLDQVGAVNSVHSTLYEAVLRGVAAGATDLEPAELQRRATFARTAASALRGYASRGGDVRNLDVTGVTKRSLAAPPVTRNAMERIAAETARLVAHVERLEPEEQRAAIEAALGELEARLAVLDQAEPVVTRTQLERTQVGAPTFHYPPVARAQRPSRVHT